MQEGTEAIMKKRIEWIIVGVVVVAGAILYAYADMQAGTQVKAARVSRGRVRAWVEDRAMTTLPLVYKITMPQAGRILPIVLKEGDAVSKGQVVARMEDTDLKTALAMAQAQVAVIESQIAVNQYHQMEKTGMVESRELIAAMNAVAKAADELIRTNKAAVKYSGWLVDVEKKLVKQNASSQEKLRSAQRDYSQADSAVASARFTSKAMWAITTAVTLLPKYIQERLSMKGLETEVLRHRLDLARGERELAERRLERASLKSPVDGIVLRRYIKNKEYLAAGTLLMEIGNLDDLEVTADILSQDVVAVRPGNPVDIYGPAIGDPCLQGTVSHVKPAGFTKVSSLGVEQQRVAVVISLNKSACQKLKERGRILGLDYRVHVRIYTNERKDVLKVPRTAVFRGAANRWQVFAVRNGKAVSVPVTLGLLNDDEAEIASGLKEGETIIAVPPKALKSGEDCRITF